MTAFILCSSFALLLLQWLHTQLPGPRPALFADVERRIVPATTDTPASSPSAVDCRLNCHGSKLQPWISSPSMFSEQMKKRISWSLPACCGLVERLTAGQTGESLSGRGNHRISPNTHRVLGNLQSPAHRRHHVGKNNAHKFSHI
jgi:hypothetical protein